MVKVVGTKVIRKSLTRDKSKVNDLMCIDGKGELGVIISVNESNGKKYYTVRWKNSPLVDSSCKITDVVEYKWANQIPMDLHADSNTVADFGSLVRGLNGCAGKEGICVDFREEHGDPQYYIHWSLDKSESWMRACEVELNVEFLLRGTATMRQSRRRKLLSIEEAELILQKDNAHHLNKSLGMSPSNRKAHREQHYLDMCKSRIKRKLEIKKQMNLEATTRASTSGAENYDAKMYEEAIENELVFYTCGICMREESLRKLMLITDCTERISLSGIEDMFTELISPLFSNTASKYEIAYARAAQQQLSAGILNGALYVCVACVNQLPKGSSKRKRPAVCSDTYDLSTLFDDQATCEYNADDESSSLSLSLNIASCCGKQIPKLALVNGYFRGECPPQLSKLNLAERSMVNLINVICKLCLRRPAYAARATVFSVLNNVQTIANSLPVHPTIQQFALIRSINDSSPEGWKYWPCNVLDALHWLDDNNHLFEGKVTLPVLGSNKPSCSGDNAIGGAGFSLSVDPHWNKLNPLHHVEHQLTFVQSEDNDLDGFDEFNEVCGVDGHPENPGAPQTGETDILLHCPEEHMDIADQLRSLTATTTRENGDVIGDYNTEYFMQMAFVTLFPYGRGGPERSNNISINDTYISHLLHLGKNREFQKESSFYFWAFTRKMKKKVGVVSYLASKNVGNPAVFQHKDFNKITSSKNAHNYNVDDINHLTVEMAKSFLEHLKKNNSDKQQPVDLIKETMLYNLINRMNPFATEVPGTSLYFKQQRPLLFSLINSPTTNNNAAWRYFWTATQSDRYCSLIYDNCITSAVEHIISNDISLGSSIALRRKAVDELTSSQRANILRAHPMISARVHYIQQDLFFKYILMGKSKPFGTIVDFWRRVEFQDKGTPHTHNMLNVAMDGITVDHVTGTPAEQIVVENLIDTVATARLQHRSICDFSDMPVDCREHVAFREDELKYDYNINRQLYFSDANHPCRHRFTARGHDYSLDLVTGDFADSEIQIHYRRLQLACQFHVCRESCWKEGNPWDIVKKCRYSFPQIAIGGDEDRIHSIVVIDRDLRERMRAKVHPPRNNANINACAFNPLVSIACNGNHDIQYVQNVYGGAEYVCKYASKADTAKSVMLKNAIFKRLAYAELNLDRDNMEFITLRQQIRSVGNAIVSAQQVGSVHACYILSGQKLIKSSRTVVNVNPLRRSEISSDNIILTREVLDTMDNSESALDQSPATQKGKRDAYHAFRNQQIEDFNVCNVDFFSFLSTFKTSVDKNKSKRGPRSKIDEKSKLLEINPDTGYITNAVTFTLNNILYSRMKALAVVHMSPHLPVDESDEQSAYAILLLHTDWGVKPHEMGILLDDTITAVERLSFLKDTLPSYVKISLNRTKHSEAKLKDSGNPRVSQTDVEDDLEDNYLEVYNEEAKQRRVEELKNIFEGVVEEQPPDLNPNDTRFLRNTPISRYYHYHNFVTNLDKNIQTHHLSSHTLTTTEITIKIQNPTQVINYDRYEQMVEELRLEEIQISAFKQQLNCYNKVVEHITGAADSQLIMFMSGEGGTGKSKIINTIRKFAQCYYGKTEGIYGPILLTAPTGAAASNIFGHTWHHALHGGFGGGRKSVHCGDEDYDGTALFDTKCISEDMCVNLQRELKGVQIFVLDEVSLLNLESLYEISCRLCVAKSKPFTVPFGGVHVILAGDFYQMKSIGGTSIVEPTLKAYTKYGKPTSDAAKAGYALFREKINCFILLTENVRAKSNNNELSELAKFASKARVVRFSGPADFYEINKRYAKGGIPEAIATADPEAVWITDTHDSIAVINKLFQQKMLSDDASNVPHEMIARHTVSGSGHPFPNTAIRDELYKNAGATHGKNKIPQSHIDLQIGTRVRLTQNISVLAGLYNGKMGTVYGFVYRGSGPQPSDDPARKYCDMEDDERELPIVLVRMDGNDDPDLTKCSFPHTCDNNVSRLVPIIPQLCTKLICGHYCRVQLPLAVAHARTCHSMQGHTAERGVVVVVGSRFFAGDYVAISRARRIEQIILLGTLNKSMFLKFTGHLLNVHLLYKRFEEMFPQNIG